MVTLPPRLHAVRLTATVVFLAAMLLPPTLRFLGYACGARAAARARRVQAAAVFFYSLQLMWVEPAMMTATLGSIPVPPGTGPLRTPWQCAVGEALLTMTGTFSGISGMPFVAPRTTLLLLASRASVPFVTRGLWAAGGVWVGGWAHALWMDAGHSALCVALAWKVLADDAAARKRFGARAAVGAGKKRA